MPQRDWYASDLRCETIMADVAEGELGLFCHDCGGWFAVEGARRPAELVSDHGIEIEAGPAITLTCLRCGKEGLYSQIELNPASGAL